MSLLSVVLGRLAAKGPPLQLDSGSARGKMLFSDGVMLDFEGRRGARCLL